MGWKNCTGLVFVALLVGVAPWVFPGVYYHFIEIGVYALVCIGLSLLLGYAGQISLGHAAFFGVGAYASAILAMQAGWSPWVTMWFGAILSALIAIVVGLPSLRLHGHYLAMATLAFGEIVYVVLNGWVKLTGGPSGLLGSIPKWHFGGWELNASNDIGLFYFTWAFVLVGLVLALHVIHSRVGRALRSIHDGEEAARVLGVATSAFKVKVFILSAVYASVAGSIYVHCKGFVNPEPFNIEHSILFVIMVIVGGMRSVWGAVAGACLMGMLPGLLADLEQWRFLIYGLILLSIMMFLPQGFLLGFRDIGLGLFRRLYGIARQKGGTHDA